MDNPINFIVDESGEPIDFKICDQGLDGYCDLVVWEVVENFPLWTPGVYEGEPVEVEYRLPVKFSLR